MFHVLAFFALLMLCCAYPRVAIQALGLCLVLGALGVAGFFAFVFLS